ncbi:MAG: hypothetical protein JNJ85_03610 [Candidatus Kapabacteria bacterium]|nr:hypothetical protein [Candidatus Kapabacteria bacterium]
MMTNTEVLEWCEGNFHDGDVVEFPNEVFQSLNDELSVAIVEKYHAHTFIRLPQREQKFFEWLRSNDPEVWNDLWQLDAEGVEPYVVSLAFLPALLDPSRGFPICDLVNTDNYFFVPLMLHSTEAKDFVEGVRNRFLQKGALTVEQLLALEADLAPIDIWHFAYHHEIDLERAKKAVERLVEDNILIHLKKSDEIAGFIE